MRWTQFSFLAVILVFSISGSAAPLHSLARGSNPSGQTLISLHARTGPSDGTRSKVEITNEEAKKQAAADPNKITRKKKTAKTPSGTPSDGTRSKVAISTVDGSIYTHEDPEKILRDARKKARLAALEKQHGGSSGLTAHINKKKAEAEAAKKKTQEPLPAVPKAGPSSQKPKATAAKDKDPAAKPKADLRPQKPQEAAAKKGDPPSQPNTDPSSQKVRTAAVKEKHPASQPNDKDSQAKGTAAKGKVTASHPNTNPGSQTQKKKKSKSKPKKKGADSLHAFSKDKKITTSALRGSRYREQAIEKTQLGKAYFKKHWAADHLLELQAVTHHINTYREHENHQTEQSQECVKSLKEHLNKVDNIAMVKTKVNNSKGVATTAFLKGKPTRHLTPAVQNHLLAHEGQMRSIAEDIDQELGKKKCGNMPPGMLKHVDHMIKVTKAVKNGVANPSV